MKIIRVDMESLQCQSCARYPLLTLFLTNTYSVLNTLSCSVKQQY